MLTSLRIQNFKGIEGPIEIPIKPVTLFFGVNSVGKSSILHTLHFIRGVLEQHDLNPSGSPFAADDIDLGGFLNLLHKHQRGRRMVLGYGIDLSELDLPEYGPTSAMSISDRVESAYIEFGFSADDLSLNPILDYYLVTLNGEDIALVMPAAAKAAAGRVRTVHVNLRHPLLISLAQSVMEDEVDVPAPLNLRVLIPQSQAEDMASPSPVDPAEAKKIRDEKVASLHAQLNHPDLLTYQVENFRNGLPPWGRLVSFDDSDGGAEGGDNEASVLDIRVLTELIVAPLEALRDYLCGSRAIGPLRAIPMRRLNLDARTDEADWYSGLAAWHRLHECADAQLAEINTWLSSPQCLGTGYALDRVDVVEVPQQFLTSLKIADQPEIQRAIPLLDELPKVTRVFLADTMNDVRVTPHDVGVGLSQLIPIVVAAVDRIGDLVLIEQPELHIHPRVQVGMGDLFLEAAKKYKRIFLIETHSEALLLRMTKRIRQTQDGDLPEGISQSSSSDLSVCLIQNEGHGVTLTRMQLNQRGELIKPWPKGLFEESLRETF